MRLPRPNLTALIACAGLAAGCSSFERDWKAAAAAPPSPDPVAGRWEGTWSSDITGHTGGLRCLVSRDEAGATFARYRATWGLGFKAEYTVPMSVEDEGEARRFRGSSDLGWLAGGVYSYEGRVTGDEFVSAYRSESDRGMFRMQRVGAETAPR